MQEKTKSNVYQITLPDAHKSIVFVNGVIARNLKGWIWLMMKLFWIRNSVKKAKGCSQVKAGLCNIKEVVMVSYWQHEEDLAAFFTSKPHKKMMKYFFQHPENLTLYNEQYHPNASGIYANEPHGLASIPFEE